MYSPDIGKGGEPALALKAASFRDTGTLGAYYRSALPPGVATRTADTNLGGEHPLIGHSVPNFEFEDGARIGELMHDGRGILLDFDRNASLKTVASEYGGRIKYISRSAKDRFAVSALLIRPDGMIAWASDNDPDRSELQKTAARWFVCNSGIKH